MGTSGSAALRSREPTASARICPLRMNGSVLDSVSTITSIRPATRSVLAGPEPLYGTCTMAPPAISATMWPERWTTVPEPDDA